MQSVAINKLFIALTSKTLRVFHASRLTALPIRTLRIVTLADLRALRMLDTLEIAGTVHFESSECLC